MQALMAQVASGDAPKLKKVTADMKTKNRPKEEGDGVVKARLSKPESASGSSAPTSTKPRAKVNDVVFVRYTGGVYYKGKVSKEPSGDVTTYSVKWEDGTEVDSVVPDAITLHPESLVSAGNAGGAGAGGAPAAAVAKKIGDTRGPEKNELRGNDIEVENLSKKGQPPIEIDNADIGKKLWIRNCNDATFVVKASKVKGITVDNCRAVNVVCVDVLSAVELVNCQKIAIQTSGSMETVQVDKTDGVNVYLSPQSTNCTFATSKSSEMNVHFTEGEGDDMNMVERCIPFQFVSKMKGGKFLTEVSDLYSEQ